MVTEKYNPTLHTMKPLYWTSRAWDGGLVFFEKSLITICHSWDDINPDRPISFTAEERSENEQSLSIWIRDPEFEQLVIEIGVQPDGHDRREEVRYRNAAVMDQFAGGLPQHERKDARRQWPFQDG